MYSTKDYNLPYLKCHVVDDLSKIPFEYFHEIKVVPIENTVVELLEDEKSDQQILLETLANYYCDHNDSYEGINFPKKISKKINWILEEGKKYYES